MGKTVSLLRTCVWSTTSSIYIYYNVTNGRQQLSTLSNVHYHCNVNCARARFPDFDPINLQIPADVRSYLLLIHRLYVFQTLGIV